MHARGVAVLVVLVGMAASRPAEAQEAAPADSGPAMAQQAAPSDSGPTVTQIMLGTGVLERELQGAAESFPSTVGTVFCFTRIGNAQPGTEVEHVWYHAGQEVARKSLAIGGSPWRTWSSKVIPPEATGDWRVEIMAGGRVLTAATFTVQ